MRWVNETFPPRERARWLLITMRLSASSLAGTARTLVAVGTVSDTFMFLTTLAAAPRSGLCLPAATGGAATLAAGFSAGFSATFGASGFGAGVAAGAGAGAAALGSAGFGAAVSAAGAPLPAVVSRSAAPTGLPGR